MSWIPPVIIPNCLSEKFFAVTTSAVELGRKFCKCPEARKVLKELAVNSRIEVNVGDHASPTVYDNGTIAIPVKEMKTSEAVQSLAYEVFNYGNLEKYSKLDWLSAKGQVGIDKHAHTHEVIEIETQLALESVLHKCSKVWDIEPKDMKETETYNKLSHEAKVWIQEAQCHADAIRANWIDKIQERYCKIQPEDLRSCMLTKDQLCDYDAVQRLPDVQKSLFQVKRVCRAISTAPQEVKELFRDLTTHACPKIYAEEHEYEKAGDHTYLLAGLAAIAAVAVVSIGVYCWLKNRNTKPVEQKQSSSLQKVDQIIKQGPPVHTLKAYRRKSNAKHR